MCCCLCDLCCYYGYATKIFLICFCTIAQCLVHSLLLGAGYSMIHCSTLPKPTQQFAMYTYMGFFYRRECLNLTLLGFPPNWTSPPTDDKTLRVLRRYHLPAWDDIKKWLNNPASSDKFFKRWSGFKNIKKHKNSQNEEIWEPEFHKETEPTFKEEDGRHKYRNVILEKPKMDDHLIGKRSIPNITERPFHDYPKTWPTFGPWIPVPKLKEIPNWLSQPKWYKLFWHGTRHDLEASNIGWPRRAKQTVNSLRFIVTYLVLNGFWFLSTILLILAGAMEIRGLKSAWLFLPWIIVTILVLIADAIATVYYGITIIQTSTWFNFLSFMGVSNMREVKDPTKFWYPKYEGYMKPAIVMTFVACRLGIIWLINLCNLIIIIDIFRSVIHTCRVTRKMVCPPGTVPQSPCRPFIPSQAEVTGVENPVPEKCAIRKFFGCDPTMGAIPGSVPNLYPNQSIGDCQYQQPTCVQSPPHLTQAQVLPLEAKKPSTLLDYLLDCC